MEQLDVISALLAVATVAGIGALIGYGIGEARRFTLDERIKELERDRDYFKGESEDVFSAFERLTRDK